MGEDVGLTFRDKKYARVASKPGEIAVKLYHERRKLPPIPIVVGIGLTIPHGVKYGTGDDLISFEGQRFLPTASDGRRAALLTKENQRPDLTGSATVIEFVMGTNPKVLVPILPSKSVDLERDRGVGWRAVGYFHSTFLTPLTPLRIGDTSNSGVEPGPIAAGCNQSSRSPWDKANAIAAGECDHAGYRGFAQLMKEIYPSLAKLSWLPTAPVVGSPVTFTFTGTNLASGYAFSLTGCVAVEVSSASTTQRQFVCTPSVAGGALPLVLKTAAGVALMYDNVAVSAAPAPVPTVNSVSWLPASPVVGSPVTFTFTGTNLASGYAFSLTGCLAVEASSASTTQRQFVCTPSIAGSALPLVLKTAAGVVLTSTNVAVTAAPAALPTVNSVSWVPASPTVGLPVTFTFTGTNLTSGYTFSLTGCVAVEVSSASTTQRQFVCTPSIAGSALPLVLKTAAGVVLTSTNVAVTAAPAAVPTVNSVSWLPASPTVGLPVTFTFTGTNLTSGYMFSLTGCPAVEVVSASTTQRQFVCTPSVGGSGLPLVLKTAAGVVLMSANVDVSAAPGTSRLNDTGITASQCYAAGSDALVSCASTAALALNAQQDGMIGRDVTNNDDSDGKAGFSFSLVPKSTGGFHDKTECVKDNVTGLTWEGKTADGLRGMSNSYTNWGDGRNGDASAYVVYVNSIALCGFSNWRLPGALELQGIMDYGLWPGSLTGRAMIDAGWFPNTASTYYWSSSPHPGNVGDAWVVIFYHGGVYLSDRFSGYHVRLVR